VTYINILCLEHRFYFLGAYQRNKSPATRMHLLIGNECEKAYVYDLCFIRKQLTEYANK